MSIKQNAWAKYKILFSQQINIDCVTREEISENISQPGPNCFDRAQRLIYGLMENDCYPRFLKSEIYQALLEQQWKHPRKKRKEIKKKKVVRHLSEWLILHYSRVSSINKRSLVCQSKRKQKGDTDLKVWLLAARHDLNNISNSFGVGFVWVDLVGFVYVMYRYSGIS